MSYSIEQKNSIFLTRGDTLMVQVGIIKDGEQYTPESGDVVRFALKHASMTPGLKQFSDQTPLVLKTIDNDTLILELEPNDTKLLDFGPYKYDIQITFANGEVDTFIPDADFVLTPEVD